MLENLNKFESKVSVPFLRALLKKVSDVSLRPEPKLGESEFKHVQSLATNKKVSLALKMLYGKGRTEKLDKEEFFLILRIICHPFVSSDSKLLQQIVNTLTNLFEQQ
mmetsp:Transcript_34907/g.53579  ORF Transcript_34907/g.53579 Transcript_34907/m.53579 type:complete len:107 (-) Transcript_34907:6287-6607(-)